MNRNSIIVISGGIISILLGTFLYSEWIRIFTKLRGKQMALSPESASYENWKSSPLPLYLDVYLFNWTNPEDFHAGSRRKPHFVELGPYKFREIGEKVNIIWHPANYSVSFQKKTRYHFVEDLSNGTLNDRITTVNIVAYATALTGKNRNPIERYLIDTLLTSNNENVTVTKTADEWLFKGYRDPILNMNRFFSLFQRKSSVPQDRIGWFYGRNNSDNYDGHFNMFTGLDDIAKMGKIYTWNFRTHNQIYGSDQCDSITGSTGEFFPPNLSPQDNVQLYIPNLCRTVRLKYTSTVKIHDVLAYKFSASESVIDNGTMYSKNKCFCNYNGHCERSGVFNVGPCKYNASFYMSYPHFYKADPYYLEHIEGLQPNANKHEMFLIIEPTTGIPMASGGGFQVNYLIEPLKYSRLFNNMPRTFIPIMWAEQRVQVNAEIAAALSWIPFLIFCGYIFSIILLVLGVILLSGHYFIKVFNCKHFMGKNKRLSKHTQELNNVEVKRIRTLSENLTLIKSKDILNIKSNI